MRPRLSGTLPALLLPLACESTPAPAVLPQWTLERELTIGALDDSEQALTEVESLVVDNEGNIYVGQSQDGYVRVFSPDGRLLRDIGRRGEGPGEFTSVGELGWKGDTLWVAEEGAPKISFFERDGRFLTSNLLPRQLVDGEYWTSSVLGLASDGTVLTRTTTYASAIQSGSVTTFPIFRLSSDGTPLGRVAETQMANTMLLIRLGQRGIGMPHPLPLRPLMTLSPNGEHLLFLHRMASTDDENAPPRLVKISSFGDTLWTKDIPNTPAVLPSTFADSVKALVAQRLVAWGVSESVHDARPIVERNIDLPPLAPPAVDMVEVCTGDIWIRRTLPGEAEDRWEVFSAGGDLMAEVLTPASTSIHESDGMYVWATERDRFNVSYVVRYKLLRG